jgi:hypothetical protein
MLKSQANEYFVLQATMVGTAVVEVMEDHTVVEVEVTVVGQIGGAAVKYFKVFISLSQSKFVLHKPYSLNYTSVLSGRLKPLINESVT